MIKRLLGLILALILLAGCKADAPDSAAAPEKTPLVSAGEQLYDPDSPVEAETGGAVRAYPLEDAECTGLAAMGDDILLFTDDGTCLTRLTGDNGLVAASASLPEGIADGSVQTAAQRFGYYDAAENAVVILDRQLSELNRTVLPEDLEGPIALSPDMGTAYYCTGQQIRAYELQTGIARLVKQDTVSSRTILQSCFGGKALACLVTERDGDSYTCFLSASTGETLGKDANLLEFATYEDAYFLQRMDGSVKERLFGTLDGETQSLNLDEDATILPALEMGGVITASSGEGALELSFYDLDSGMRTAMVTLPEVAQPTACLAGQKYVWFAAYDETTNQQVLYRWEVAQSPAADKAVYTGPRYTAEAPDLEGLAACQELVEKIGEQYSVDVLIAAAAVEQSCDEALEQEYQVEVIRESLDALAEILAQYPEGFFQPICRGTDSGVLHICLVRSIANGLTGVQYWPNGDAYIALAVGDTLEQSFYHELSYVLDAYIIANSLAYDEWDSLNPEGVSYDYSYLLYAQRDEQDYLTGEDQAFIDAYSMTYPKEDRARIMEYAMTAGHEELFQAEVLQQKLRQICIAIRDAFDLKKDPSVFPLEQYLQEPLAYREAE